MGGQGRRSDSSLPLRGSGAASPGAEKKECHCRRPARKQRRQASAVISPPDGWRVGSVAGGWAGSNVNQSARSHIGGSRRLIYVGLLGCHRHLHGRQAQLVQGGLKATLGAGLVGLHIRGRR